MVVSAALTGSACGDSPASSRDRSSAVIPSAAGPPGTSLGDGFTVVDGTTLIGDPIPLGDTAVRAGQQIVDQGWTATLIVDGGDPIELVDAYVRQAEDTGLVRELGTRCDFDDVVTCSAFARSPDVIEPRSVSATFVRGHSDDVYSDHVIVRYSTADDYWHHGGRERNSPPDAPLPAPAEWPPMPSAGDRLGTAGETSRGVPLQEGSRLAGPPRLNLDDTTGGIVAVLEVTGDPRSVLRAYLDYMEDEGIDGRSPDVLEVGDAEVTTAEWSEAGGDHFDFTLVERQGRPTWLLIEGSHD